jgi:RHS repeat-associated protein
VRAITDAGGVVIERAVYQPYGEQTESLTSPVTPETKGWIGERYDADAGLQYLNARYYDPVLGLFAQPDWYEVMRAGVGTNRYGYAFGDPVNARDPGGNATCGDSMGEGSADCDEAMDAADEDRDDMNDNADTADQIVEQKGVVEGGYFSEQQSFMRRYRRSYGKDVTVTDLEKYSGMARGAADYIGERGEGVVIEDLGNFEASFKAGYSGDPKNYHAALNAAVAQKFGLSGRFADGKGGYSASFADRWTRAIAWSQPGVHGSVFLDNGFNGRNGTIAHEVAHTLLGLVDYNELAGNGYGRSGISAALNAGVQWNNADSFAYTIRRGFQ